MRVRSKRQQRKVKAFLRFSARETKVLLIIDFELVFIVQVKGEIFAFLLKLILLDLTSVEWMSGQPGAMQTNVGSNKISLIFINTVHTFHIHSCREFLVHCA